MNDPITKFALSRRPVRCSVSRAWISFFPTRSVEAVSSWILVLAARNRTKLMLENPPVEMNLQTSSFSGSRSRSPSISRTDRTRLNLRRFFRWIRI